LLVKQARTSKSVGNTVTDGEVVLLHGNRIIERREDGSIWATLAGWPTPTTRERLGIVGDFYQSKQKQYYNGSQISDTEWVQVAPPELINN